MKRLTLTVVVASLVGLLVPLGAQSPPALAEYVHVATVTVRPAAVAEFENYLKRINAAALKAGIKARSDTYQVVHGGSPFQYDVVTVQPTLAAIGELPPVPTILARAHGDAEAGKILRAGRNAIESVEFMVLRLRPELSINLRDVAGSPFFQLMQVEIKPEMQTAYTEYVRKLKAAREKQAGAPSAFRHISMFGRGFTYFVATPFATWAEREKWPTPAAALTAEYGEAESAKLLETNRQALVDLRTWIVAHRRDLSRIPAGTTTN